MKAKKLMFMIFALIGVLSITSGCPGPLSFSGVRNPGLTSDGSGGAIVTYQVNGNETQTTYIQKLGTNGEFQWGGKGITLYSEQGPSEGGGASALLVNSDNYSTILVWAQADSIWTQKIDSGGHFLWGAGNVRVTSGTYILKAISDSLSGVVMAWSDDHDNLYLQRIDSQGNLLWSVNKPLIQTRPFDISCDGSGNTFVVWEDKDFNVLVQKLDSTGEASWLPDGLLLSDLHGPGVGMDSITNDGAGGAIVAWICGISSEDKVGITGQELYTQRVSAEGKTLWATGGLPIRTMAQRDSIPFEPQMTSDNTGGAFIFWRDDMSIYAQRIDATGESLWAQGGIEVWKGEGSLRSPYFSVAADGSGGVIVVWNYTEKGKRADQSPSLRAQRLDASGKKLWGESGVLVTSGSQGYLTPALIAPDGNGGAFFSWAAGKNIHKATLSYAQRASAEGKLLWGEDGIRLNP